AVQLLSNGRYHVMVSSGGGGYSRLRDLAVTRWHEDISSDHWGQFCYLRDVETGAFWSTAHQPTLHRPEHFEAIFSDARAEFRVRERDYDAHTEIVVSPEDDIELRRVRLTNRYADNIDTGYNWMPVFQTWMQYWALPGGVPLPGLDLNSTVNSSLVHLDTFKNFYKGDAGVPGAFYAPVLSTALGYPGSYAAIHDAAIPFYSCCYANPYQPTLLDAAHTNVQHEKTYAAYAMLDFGIDEANLTGNVGVRAVKTRNSADGFLVYPNLALAPYLGAGQSAPINARNEYTDVLPSLNVKWELAPDWVTRFAFSKAIARPDFSQMQAYQILNAAVVSGYTPPPGATSLPIDKLTLTGSSNSNPYLTPMKANQFDLSLEWYFDQDRGGMAWINLFHKGIRDYFRNESRFVTYPGVDGNSYPYLITRPVNVGKATIDGAEFGWNQF
ncbi:MAG: hypothetical protein B7X33_04680, partial [Lysobacterales bacterium 13-68-4]